MKQALVKKAIPVSQLLLDTQNPRIPDIQDSQHEAIRAMAKAQGDKVLGLAKHLLENGPNPSNLPIVMLSGSERNMYVVLDGNRRITALKLLETPSISQGLFNEAAQRKLKDFAARFEKEPIAELDCVVVGDREEADKWIQLIHRGEQQGAGLVEWDGQVAARYDARKGRKHSNSAALEVLDFVKGDEAISNATRRRVEEGKFPITSLQRMINTPFVRSKLGIEMSEQGVLTKYPKDEVLKGLTRLVDDLGTGEITVTNIKTQQQRIDYVSNLDKEDLPASDTALALAGPLGQAPKRQQPQAKATKGRRQSGSTNRGTLIPSGCKLDIDHARIHKIFIELKRLNVDDFPNAAAVMLRVFIELSLDHYIPNKLAWDRQKLDNSSLKEKLLGVAKYLESNKLMTRDQLLPVKRAAQGQPILASSVVTMNAYVHNMHLSPVASELKTAWDDLQPFMGKVWAG